MKPVVSHIGIAVKDLKQAIETYKLLTGDTNPKIEHVADQKTGVAIFSASGITGGRVELVAAAEEGSPIAKFIEKKGEGLHHICIYVDERMGVF